MSARVTAPPRTLCQITYLMPDGHAPRLAGLESKTTDSARHAAWAWDITTTTPPGIGNACMICGGIESPSVHVIIGGVQEPPGREAAVQGNRDVACWHGYRTSPQSRKPCASLRRAVPRGESIRCIASSRVWWHRV